MSELKADEILRYPLNLQDDANNGIVKITIKERRDAQVMKHIFLPMPTGFNISDGASFTNFERGMGSMAFDRGKDALAAFTAGGGLKDPKAGLANAMAELNIGLRGGSMDDITGSASAFAADSAAMGLLFLGGLPGGAGIGAQEAAFAAGAAIDKGARSRFQDNTIREYNLTIQMSPRNQKENKEIDKIIKMLRRYSYANRGSNTFALDYPPEMLVEFYHTTKATEDSDGKINEFMPVLMPSYLKTVSTTYNPNTFALHHDGGMEQYDLALSFGEIKRLTRDELEVLEMNKMEQNRHSELYLEQQMVEEAARKAEASGKNAYEDMS